jgi:hypothetical protein
MFENDRMERGRYDYVRWGVGDGTTAGLREEQRS